jgi:putative peptide zinc metalloprotease protein
MELAGVAGLVWSLYTENFLTQRYIDVDHMLDKAMHPSRRKLRQFARTLSVNWEQPERPVKWAYDHGLRWTLTKPFVITSFFIVVAGVWAFVKNYQSHLFGLTGKSLLIGFLVLIAIDYFMVAVHEMGHALVLFHNGRRMKNAGFQLYFGCPAFFVDASDGLMMARKWRVLQAVAGPYGQAVGAGIASIIAWAYPQWAVSETLYRYSVLAYLNIFLNLTPLLELDGYWALSDLLKIPDLRPRSIEFVQHDLVHKLRTRERWHAADLGLLLYGVLGLVATVLILFSGFFFWRVVFGGLVTSMWNGGIETRVILLILGLFILNPVIRAVIRGIAALGRRIRILGRQLRFRLQRRWRVEAARMIDALPLFDDVPEEVLNQVAGRVRLRSVRSGQTVFRQGERAEAFYVIRKGNLRVVEENPETGAEVRTLRVLGRGESFGEVGLAESAHRSATIRASGDAELFEVDKGTFDELLADRVHLPEFAPTLQAVTELGELRCFAFLQPDELAQLYEHGEWINVPPTTAIIQQGAAGDAFYAVGSGQVSVEDDGKAVRTLGPGSHFGEVALLLDIPRTATVRALTPVRAFRLDRPGFDQLIRGAFKTGAVSPVVPLDRIEDH